MGHGHRNMYYATGLPGWMRFGYSPGWGGLPPGASYLMTGQWPTPQMAAAWQSGWAGPGQEGPWYGAPGAGPAGPGPVGLGGPAGPGYGASPEQELEFLKNQASMLEQQMDQILKRIDEIEKEEKPKKK